MGHVDPMARAPSRIQSRRSPPPPTDHARSALKPRPKTRTPFARVAPEAGPNRPKTQHPSPRRSGLAPLIPILGQFRATSTPATSKSATSTTLPMAIWRSPIAAGDSRPGWRTRKSFAISLLSRRSAAGTTSPSKGPTDSEKRRGNRRTSPGLPSAATGRASLNARSSSA